MEGLPDKTFNSFLDTYLETGKCENLELYEQMSDEQRFVIQHIKKSLKRIKRNYENNTDKK